jgi:hypothetical protein
MAGVWRDLLHGPLLPLTGMLLWHACCVFEFAGKQAGWERTGFATCCSHNLRLALQRSAQVSYV